MAAPPRAAPVYPGITTGGAAPAPRPPLPPLPPLAPLLLRVAWLVALAGVDPYGITIWAAESSRGPPCEGLSLLIAPLGGEARMWLQSPVFFKSPPLGALWVLMLGPRSACSWVTARRPIVTTPFLMCDVIAIEIQSSMGAAITARNSKSLTPLVQRHRRLDRRFLYATRRFRRASKERLPCSVRWLGTSASTPASSDSPSSPGFPCISSSPLVIIKCSTS